MKVETSNTDFNLVNQDEMQSEDYFTPHQQDNLPSTLVNILPGVSIVLIIGIAAYSISQLHPSLDSLMLAIIFGLFLRMFLGNAAIFLPGAFVAARILLPLGIISYGIGLDLSNFVRLPGKTVLLVLSIAILFFVVMYLLNRWLKIPPTLGFLIASGSAIYGISAIAVLSSTTDSEPEDTSISILVVTAISLLGAMVFPLLSEILNLPDLVYAVLSGATLQQIGIVPDSLGGISGEVLNYSFTLATIRILMLLGLALSTGLLWHRSRHTVRLKSLVNRTWFLIPFSLVVILGSISPGINALLMNFKALGAIVFTIALSSIGFMVNIEKLLTVGSKPLIFGLIGWIFVVCLILWLWPLYV